MAAAAVAARWVPAANLHGVSSLRSSGGGRWVDRGGSLRRLCLARGRRGYAGIRASSKASAPDAAPPVKNVRVRFAPSPTGNLHVGGARTALFNFLFARSTGGTFILRVEDTDVERSTRESELALLGDLAWMGLHHDEGPVSGGEFAPYRQSERKQIYQEYADKLLKAGQVYRCFCSDEELEAQREEAKAKNLPPRYAGKWGTASQAEIDVELKKGTPCTYRFRVPQEGSVTINDLIRGEISWNKDTLGDFVVMRSNGQPVYNFCVAVDDAAMKITHVLRGEEHLPNTLRQVLIYEALGLPMPQFGHVSLILATDRSKLSKRHGATSVGQFKEMGYLQEALVNYLATLGWNDGSEEEIFSVETIIQKFSVDRITKSAAIFDITKLGWMNSQYLRALPVEAVSEKFGGFWLKAGIVSKADGPFVTKAAELVKNAIDFISEGESALLNILAYPLQTTLQSEAAGAFVEDNLKEVAAAVLGAYESGALQAAISGGHDTWKKWVNGLGKSQKRKGKRLFMPIRIVLTGRMQGPDIGLILALLEEGERSDIVTPAAGLVPLAQRIAILKEVDWSATAQWASTSSSPASTSSSPVLTH